MIRVYNTLTRNKEPFEPLRPGRVGIYLCGPTVYKPSHIGHMVGPVIFDTIKRFLTYCGYQVTLVVNITDVDDKLIAESNRLGIPMSQLAEQMTADYMRNIRALGVDTIDYFPRCTENIDEIIRFTEQLIDRGFAYVSDGDVYFDVSKARDYGKLSHRSPEAMQGEGGEAAQRKRSPADFALWKSAKPGEPSWPSPWGPGRPGWHIECSAMSRRLLGESFDIHGGGLDLVFPHHENEIAQSESAHGKPMAKYWMHNGLMQAADEVGKVGGRSTRPAADDIDSQQAAKISKSRGASPFSQLLEDFPPEVIRFFILATHYRRPIEFSESRLGEVQTAVESFYRFFHRYQNITGESFYRLPAPADRRQGDAQADDPLMPEAVVQQRQRFLEAMDDDFNTGGAIGVLFDLLRTLNRLADEEKLEVPQTRSSEKLQAFRKAAVVLKELAGILGLFRQPPAEKSTRDDALVSNLMQLLLEIRGEARQKKDFQTADRIRNRLAQLGIKLEDRPGGTEWSRQ